MTGIAARPYTIRKGTTLDGFGTLRNLRDGGNTLGGDVRYDAFGLHMIFNV